MTSVVVTTVAPARSLSALLAATDWPEREQKPVPRGVHPEAAALRRHVSGFRDQPAVHYLQSQLNADPELPSVFARALSGEPELAAHLESFAYAADLQAYWPEHATAWAASVSEVQQHLNGLPLREFLVELFEGVPESVIVHPNLAYPTTHSLGVRAGNALYSIMPPRKAVGESQPWPFGDDRDYVVRLAVHDFVQACLNDLLSQQPSLIPAGKNTDRLPADFRAEHPSWPRQVIALFAYGAQVIFLNRLDDGAGDSFALFERRTRHLTLLPDVVHELTNYVAGRGVAARYASLAAYLPHFAARLDQLLSESQRPARS